MTSEQERRAQMLEEHRKRTIGERSEHQKHVPATRRSKPVRVRPDNSGSVYE